MDENAVSNTEYRHLGCPDAIIMHGQTHDQIVHADDLNYAIDNMHGSDNSDALTSCNQLSLTWIVFVAYLLPNPHK